MRPMFVSTNTAASSAPPAPSQPDSALTVNNPSASTTSALGARAAHSLRGLPATLNAPAASQLMSGGFAR